MRLEDLRADLDSIARILLDVCDSAEGIDAISVHADVTDNEPYFAVRCYARDEVALSFSEFAEVGK